MILDLWLSQLPEHCHLYLCKADQMSAGQCLTTLFFCFRPSPTCRCYVGVPTCHYATAAQLLQSHYPTLRRRR